MSDTVTQNLSRQKIQQILASIGSQTPDDSDKIETTDYNWHEPHCFDTNQSKELNNFTEKIARNCTEKFTQLYNNDFNVEITSTTQHFASDFIDSDNIQSDYYLAFGTENQTFGLVTMPNQTATTWAARLLGDADTTENEDRALSQLEQSLLFDIASGIIKALSNSHDNYDLHPVGNIVAGQLPIELEGTEELCKIAFSVKEPDSEDSSDAYLLILCDKLEVVVGQKVQTSENITSETIKKMMLGHVQEISVSVTCQLSQIMVNLEDIMSLQVDDVILLDKGVNEFLEVIVDGKKTLRGRPGKTDGKYAVLITELCNTN